MCFIIIYRSSVGYKYSNSNWTILVEGQLHTLNYSNHFNVNRIRYISFVLYSHISYIKVAKEEFSEATIGCNDDVMGPVFQKLFTTDYFKTTAVKGS